MSNAVSSTKSNTATEQKFPFAQKWVSRFFKVRFVEHRLMLFRSGCRDRQSNRRGEERGPLLWSRAAGVGCWSRLRCSGKVLPELFAVRGWNLERRTGNRDSLGKWNWKVRLVWKVKLESEISLEVKLESKISSKKLKLLSPETEIRIGSWESEVGKWY